MSTRLKSTSRKLLAGLLAGVLMTGATFAQGSQSLKVATSTYPGWMDNWLMGMKLRGKKEPTFLEARNKEFGAKVEIKTFPLYLPSVEALVSGEVDACTMAIQEAVTVVSDKGVDCVVLFPHDYSNGNDQLQMPKAWSKADLAGKTVLLEEFSVSHYLLYRYLQENKLGFKDHVVIKNTPGDNVAPAYIAALGNTPVAGATWNPGCQRMIETGKSQVVFSSKDIPGEITDCLVIRKDRIADREKAIKAYVAAHFDVMKHLTDPKTRADAIEAMAVSAGFKPEEVSAYSAMLGATRFYTNKAEAKAALIAPELPAAVEKVKEFYKTYAEPNAKPGTISFDASFLD